MRSPESARWALEAHVRQRLVDQLDALDGGISAQVDVRDHAPDYPTVGVLVDGHVDEHVVAGQEGGHDPDLVTQVQVRARRFWPGHVDHPEDSLSTV